MISSSAQASSLLPPIAVLGNPIDTTTIRQNSGTSNTGSTALSDSSNTGNTTLSGNSASAALSGNLVNAALQAHYAMLLQQSAAAAHHHNNHRSPFGAFAAPAIHPAPVVEQPPWAARLAALAQQQGNMAAATMPHQHNVHKWGLSKLGTFITGLGRRFNNRQHVNMFKCSTKYSTYYFFSFYIIQLSTVLFSTYHTMLQF
jgi:hypothetical protein